MPRARRPTCRAAAESRLACLGVFLTVTGRLLAVRSVGKYVKCLGNIRNFQGKKNIGANLICLVKDPNQIMFHYLQAITVHKANTTANVRRSSALL